MSTKYISKVDRLNFNSFIKGHVDILKNGIPIFSGDNHIVRQGANWLMQRFINVDYSIDNAKSQWLPRWFSIGTGGATEDTPFDPLVVKDDDTDLTQIIKFNDIGGAIYDDTITRKLIDSIEFVEETVVKITMTIDVNDAVDQYINEAGIFVSPSASQDETHFTMFSKITFPTIPKSGADKLIIEWYFVF